jgi:hypothetical protein
VHDYARLVRVLPLRAVVPDRASWHMIAPVGTMIAWSVMATDWQSVVAGQHRFDR